jgi:hypothetical protein
MASEIEQLYELKCEIKCCEICGDWIDWTNKLVIIKRKHYHKNCILTLYREFLHTQKLAPCLIPSAPYRQPYPR